MVPLYIASLSNLTLMQIPIFPTKVRVTEADSALGRRKSSMFNPPSYSREYKVVYPLKADYYIIYATTEGTHSYVNKLSRLGSNDTLTLTLIKYLSNLV